MSLKIRLYQAFTTTGCLSDRLSSTWTVVILLILSAITFWMQLYTDPISCFTPAHFTGAHVHFAHKHCWYANVITKAQDLSYGYSDFSDELLPVLSENVMNEKSQRTMYQWLPLVLVFQALLFKLPDIIWTAGLSMVGFNIGKLNGISDGYGSLPNVERKLVGKQMARYLYHYVKSSTLKGCPWGFISLLYIFIKSLFFANAVSQFVMLNQYLVGNNDKNTTQYSDLLFNNLNDNNASSWSDSNAFPTSVLCSFSIRQLQSIQTWTAQCTIPLNNWYHLISALVWVWLLFIMMVTVISCAVDAIKFILPVCRKRFMKSYLSMMDGQSHDTAVNAFASFLGQDVVIILRILGESSGELLVGDTVIGLWEVHTGRGKDSPDIQTNMPGAQARPEAPPLAVHYGAQPGQPVGLVYHRQLPQENIPLVQTDSSDMYPKLD